MRKLYTIMFFTILILLAGTVIVLNNPAADYWYYGTAIAELLMMAGNGLSGSGEAASKGGREHQQPQ